MKRAAKECFVCMCEKTKDSRGRPQEWAGDRCEKLHVSGWVSLPLFHLSAHPVVLTVACADRSSYGHESRRLHPRPRRNRTPGFSGRGQAAGCLDWLESHYKTNTLGGSCAGPRCGERLAWAMDPARRKAPQKSSLSALSMSPGVESGIAFWPHSPRNSVYKAPR